MDKSAYINPEQLAVNNNTTVRDMVGKYYLSPTVPACCKHECIVEPDGICQHGQPSVLVAMQIL